MVYEKYVHCMENINSYFNFSVEKDPILEFKFVSNIQTGFHYVSTYHACSSLCHTRNNLLSYSLGLYVDKDNPYCDTLLCMCMYSYCSQSNVLQTKFTEEMTFWHLGHVILVKVLTVISFLAQMADPVLTHNGGTLP